MCLFSYLEMNECYKLGRTNTFSFNGYFKFCKNLKLPELLLELSKKSISEGLGLKDGNYWFKRVEGSVVCIYELYCTNLNFKAMNIID